MRAGQTLVARELVNLRYELARLHDLPARAVMPDAAVLELSKRKPTDRGAIMGMGGVPRRILQDHADQIGAAIARAKAIVPEGEPNGSMMDEPRVRAECDQLWNVLQVRAGSVGLAGNLVATRGNFTRWFVGSSRHAGRGAMPARARGRRPSSPRGDGAPRRSGAGSTGSCGGPSGWSWSGPPRARWHPA